MWINRFNKSNAPVTAPSSPSVTTVTDKVTESGLTRVRTQQVCGCTKPLQQPLQDAAENGTGTKDNVYPVSVERWVFGDGVA